MYPHTLIYNLITIIIRRKFSTDNRLIFSNKHKPLNNCTHQQISNSNKVKEHQFLSLVRMKLINSPINLTNFLEIGLTENKVKIPAKNSPLFRIASDTI